MKIRVLINDGLRCRMHLEYTGCDMSTTFRTVDIELTDEQTRQLQLQEIGFSNGKPVRETIADVCIVD